MNTVFSYTIIINHCWDKTDVEPWGVPHVTMADEWKAQGDKKSQTHEAGINLEQSPRGQNPPVAS